MDTIVTIVAWVQLALSTFVLFMHLRRMWSKEAARYEYVTTIVGYGMALVLTGRCLGWW